MYDRLTVGLSARELKDHFKVEMQDEFAATFNAAPTQKLPVITNISPNEIQLFNWGLISKLSNNKSISPRLYNLPAELAATKSIYKKPIAENRCLILVDGFYAWKQMGKKSQVPHFVYANDRMPFCIAGIWEEYEDFDGIVSRSFNLITRNSQEPIKAIQEDVPAILDAKEAETWLSIYSDEEDVLSILENYHKINLNYHPVSPLINNLKIYDQRLIEPTQPSDQHGNYTLF